MVIEEYRTFDRKDQHVGMSCTGCAFKNDDILCQKAWNHTKCFTDDTDIVFLAPNVEAVGTRVGYYTYNKLTGEVLDHELTEDFGPAPIHITEGGYWYLDSFNNPVEFRHE